jgi:predicted  nucleic acid-binding Zn-ribbon protein
MVNFSERKVTFSEQKPSPKFGTNEQGLKKYMRDCNRLIRESAKIKSQAQNLEKSIDKGIKKGKDKSRMILLLREKNKRLKRKLKGEQLKFDQYEKILEDNIELKDEIRALESA